VTRSLALQIVKDGEGATKFVEITVRGAKNPVEARRAVSAVAKSSLVKTALFGEDANWGRIMAVLGSCGVDMDEVRTDISFARRTWLRRASLWANTRRKKLLPHSSSGRSTSASISIKGRRIDDLDLRPIHGIC